MTRLCACGNEIKNLPAYVDNGVCRDCAGMKDPVPSIYEWSEEDKPEKIFGCTKCKEKFHSTREHWDYPKGARDKVCKACRATSRTRGWAKGKPRKVEVVA
jgi:hypothetical protein